MHGKENISEVDIYAQLSTYSMIDLQNAVRLGQYIHGMAKTCGHNMYTEWHPYYTCVKLVLRSLMYDC